MSGSLTATLMTLACLMLPLSYAGGAALQASAVRFSQAGRWRLSLAAAWTGFTATLVAAGLGVSGAQALPGLLRVDGLSLSVALLIGFIGLMILRFSRHYLGGDTGQRRYQMWFLATLASVATLVLSNHMALFFAGWVLSSLCLHRLLVFYPRKRALLAAHKKFLISRVADVALLAALLIVADHSQTLYLSTALADLAGAPFGTALQIAALLLVVAAVFKCAQLPVHGWLLQVMEAPTPVSALLHAGIVNMGGFLLILFAPLIASVPLAQWLLVLIGGGTASVASLVMLTRISIKVMLAWSTCAQMGFMLLECGLGAYELALLHLIGHSLYKAFRFLNAGESVNAYLAQRQAQPPKLRHGMVALLIGIPALMATAFGLVVYAELSLMPGQWAMTAILAMAALSWLAMAWQSQRGSNRLLLSLGGLSLLGVYLLSHHLFAGLISPAGGASVALAATAALGFLVLFALYWNLQLYPQSWLARRLYPAFYGGLYLDEWLTHATLRWWPTQLTDQPRSANAAGQTVQQGG